MPLEMAASWFDSLAPELRDWLRARMSPVTLEAGATLFRAGDLSDSLSLVTRGALGAFAPGEDARLLGKDEGPEQV